MPKPQRKKIVIDPLRDYSNDQLDRLYYMEGITPDDLKKMPQQLRQKYQYLFWRICVIWLLNTGHIFQVINSILDFPKRKFILLIQ